MPKLIKCSDFAVFKSCHSVQMHGLVNTIKLTLPSPFFTYSIDEKAMWWLMYYVMM